MPGVFISYRRDDTNPYAGRLYDWLSKSFGEDHVFKDTDNIPGGQDFREASLAGIDSADVVLALIGENWNIKNRLHDPEDTLRQEIERGLSKCLLVPILIDGISMPSGADLPESIRVLVNLNALPLRDDPDFHKDVDRIIKHIKDNIPSAKTWSQRKGIYVSPNCSPLIQKVVDAANGIDENEFKRALQTLRAAKRDPDAAETLKSIAENSYIPHRSHQATIALVEFTQYSDVHWPSIEDAALQGDVDTRQKAWEVLGNLGGHKSVDILAKALQEGPAANPSNRRDIIEHLGRTARTGDFYARQFIFEHYQRRPINGIEKQAVIVALRYFENDDVSTSFLLNEIPNLEGDFLKEAIRSLIKIGTEKAVEGIKDSLLSSEDLRRKSTIIVKIGEADSLGKIGSQTALKLLEEIMPRLPTVLRNAALEQSQRLENYLARNP